jgi:hypothetical protein
MCVAKKSDYKFNVWGWDHATCSLNGPKCSINVSRQAAGMMRQDVCLILEISWNVRNDTPISTFCPPLSTHCLFVKGDMAVKELVETHKNKQYHKPLNPLRCAYCPTTPQTVCLLDKSCPFMVCKINTGLQCKCSCVYKHLLSLHQQIRYNIHSWIPFLVHDRSVIFHFLQQTCSNCDSPNPVLLMWIVRVSRRVSFRTSVRQEGLAYDIARCQKPRRLHPDNTSIFLFVTPQISFLYGVTLTMKITTWHDMTPCWHGAMSCPVRYSSASYF